uniref:Uncharacterized protein n=1 Tax=Sus scrofa TaxID=9823 RepID=A0A286ZMH0_PIG
MSRRALRRLRGEQRGQEPLGPGALQFVLHDDDDAEEECPQQGPGGRRARGTGKEGVRVNNRFELINIEDLDEGPVVNGGRTDCPLTDTVASGSKRRPQGGRTATKRDGNVADRAVPPEQSSASGKLRKKKRKQKNKKNAAGETSEDGLEDIGRILERIEDGSGSRRPGPPPLSSRKHVLYVEHRHLNPDTELKRYFGARAVLGEQRLPSLSFGCCCLRRTHPCFSCMEFGFLAGCDLCPCGLWWLMSFCGQRAPRAWAFPWRRLSQPSPRCGSPPLAGTFSFQVRIFSGYGAKCLLKKELLIQAAQSCLL